MTEITITNFDGVDTFYTPNTQVLASAWTSLSYSDSFDDSSLDSDKWTIVTGTHVETTFLSQSATASTSVLDSKLPFPVESDLTFTLDVTSLGSSNKSYLELSASSLTVKIGIWNDSGSLKYWFESVETTNNVPSLRESHTQSCGSSTPSIRVVVLGSAVYMIVDGSIVASDSDHRLFRDKKYSLNTYSQSSLATTLWTSLQFVREYTTLSRWRSELLDAGESIFWKSLKLDNFLVGADLEAIVMLRTTDDSTPGRLDWSSFASVIHQDNVALDFSNLVPTRRYCQVQVIVRPKFYTAIDRRTVSQTFLADGTTNTYTLAASPIDKRVELSEQGLSQNKTEYVVEGTSLTITPVPQADTKIVVSYSVPEI